MRVFKFARFARPPELAKRSRFALFGFFVYGRWKLRDSRLRSREYTAVPVALFPRFRCPPSVLDHGVSAGVGVPHLTGIDSPHSRQTSPQHLPTR
jgi:hypothetical protein